MQKISIALDWTPNTNHTGFYVAVSKGLYQEEGLDVSFISPHQDEYKTTPASRVADGTATFAVTPSETVVSYFTNPDQSKPKLNAVATLLSTSDSAIVTLASSGLDRPQKLDGKKYASYAARYEGRIVQQMIINDGGKGDYIETVPPMLGIWDTLVKGEADATWVFLGWEGVAAELQNLKLNCFKLEDFGIQYGYSPVLVAHPTTLSEQGEMVRKFLRATSRGYQYAVKNPGEAAEILLTQVAKDTAESPLPTPLEKDHVMASQARMAEHYLNSEGQWGVMAPATWDAFIDWLSANGLLTRHIQSRDPKPGVSSTLDGLRGGDVGDAIPRDQVPSSKLFTNEFYES